MSDTNPKDKHSLSCDTCGDTGVIDETLGGWGAGLRTDAPCPDCVAPVKIQKYTLPKPRVCLCDWLGIIGIKCGAHSRKVA